MGNPFHPIRKRWCQLFHCSKFLVRRASFLWQYIARQILSFRRLKRAEKQLCLGVLAVGSNLWINQWKIILPTKKTKTRAKTQRDMKLLTTFLLEKNEQRKLEEIQPEELNWYIGEFIVSVKRKDGQDYEPSSLRSLFSSFNRYLKRTGKGRNPMQPKLCLV